MVGDQLGDTLPQTQAPQAWGARAITSFEPVTVIANSAVNTLALDIDDARAASLTLEADLIGGKRSSSNSRKTVGKRLPGVK